MSFINLLGVAIAFITLILTVTIAFPEGRAWIKSKYLKFLSFTSPLPEKLSVRFSSLAVGLTEAIFFLRTLLLLLYFLLVPLLIVYFFIPSAQALIIKIYSGTALMASESKTLGLIISVYLYFISIIIFITYSLIRNINILRNRVIHLYSLKPIVEMTNEQRKMIFQALRSNWKNMTLTLGADVYPQISGAFLTRTDSYKEYVQKEYVKIANLLEICNPLSFENGVLSIECPNISVHKQLLRNSLYLEDFLSRRIEFLTGLGYKEEFAEPIHYAVSKVDLSISRNTPQTDIVVKGAKGNKKKNL